MAQKHRPLNFFVMSAEKNAARSIGRSRARMPTDRRPLMTASASGANTTSVATSPASKPFG